MPLSPLESRLRYEFRNAELLRQALTHRSHSSTHNERLEFLGDSVLNCAVAALLFQRFGKLDEGDLSRVRANLVKQQSLYEIAQALNISEGLRLGEGELRSGGFRRPSILADTLEAVLGAIFLDGGFEAAQTVIKRLYVPILDHIDPRTLGKDAKTLLQEYLQGHKIALPTYTVVATHGAAHNQQFEVECTVPKLDVKVSGSGASRRAAEQAAAKKALDEVMAAAPAVVAKPKRSKGARAAKNAEQDIVPGVTGVQAALDLRTPDRQSERGTARGDGRVAAAVVEAYADKPAPERPAAERAAAGAAGAPLAVIRAAHVEYSGQDKPERAEKSEKAERTDKASVHASEKPADKPGAEKPATDKLVTDRSPDLKAEAPSHARGTDRQRSREAAPGTAAPGMSAATVPAASAAPATAEHEPGVAGAVHTRVADAGH
jgi:ribonuclease-3